MFNENFSQVKEKALFHAIKITDTALASAITSSGGDAYKKDICSGIILILEMLGDRLTEVDDQYGIISTAYEQVSDDLDAFLKDLARN